MTSVPSPEEQLLEVRRSADRLLSLLLVLHLPATFGLAVLHGTWIATFLVGGGVSGGAYLLARRAPGAFSTRAFIAVGLAAYGALLVDQSHGLIEMHFYFFSSLAFLLIYRDWRLILINAGAIAVHHLAFMVLQQGGAPVWVMPAGHVGLGMVLLHAAFVVFDQSDPLTSKILVFRSTDAGVTWTAGAVVSEPLTRNQSPWIVIDPNDARTMYIGWRVFSARPGGVANAIVGKKSISCTMSFET